MKTKLNKYLAIMLFALFSILIAEPNYKLLALNTSAASRENEFIPASKKSDLKLNTKKSPHLFKSKFACIAPPVQRCIKTLKI